MKKNEKKKEEKESLLGEIYILPISLLNSPHLSGTIWTTVTDSSPL